VLHCVQRTLVRSVFNIAMDGSPRNETRSGAGN
jgi:hypothetical protein